MKSLQMHRNVGSDSQILGSLTVAVIEGYWLYDNSCIWVFQQSFEIWEAIASVPGLMGHARRTEASLV